MAETFSASITCERTAVKPVVGAALRAILFQRAFGTSKPSTTRVCGVELPCVPSAEIDSVIDAKTDEIYRSLEQQQPIAGKARSATATVSFCEEQIRRTWYSKVVEEVPFEVHNLTLSVMTGQTERERNKIDATTRQQLSSFVMSLLVFADSHKAHIPPITSNNIVPFPWKISVGAGTL